MTLAEHTPTARTQPLVRVAVLATIALVVASCGGDGGNGPVSTTAASSTTASTAPSAAAPDLSELLLTAAEVGEGWTEVGTTTPEPGLALCDKAPEADIAALNDPSETEGLDELQRVFRSDESTTASDSGPLKLVESLVRDERTPEGFATLQRVFDACIGETWTELNLSTHLEPMTAPELGDQAVAYLLTSTEPATATTPEHTWRGPILFVLIGDVLLSLHSVDVHETGSTPRLSDAEFDEIATKAVDKVAATR